MNLEQGKNLSRVFLHSYTILNGRPVVGEIMKLISGGLHERHAS